MSEAVSASATGIEHRSPVLRFLSRRRAAALAAVGTAAALALIAALPPAVETYLGAWTLLATAMIYLGWGSARGELTNAPLLGVQTFGVLAFGAIAIAAVAVTPRAAPYVLAGGWLAHAVWDLVHHRLDRVVPRWYAEACLVSALMVGTALLSTAPL